MDSEGIMLSEMSDPEKQVSYDITFIWNLKSPNHRNRVEWWLPGAGHGRNEVLVKEHKLSLIR